MKLTKENVHNALNDWTPIDEDKRKHTELIENEFRKQCYHKATMFTKKRERMIWDRVVIAILFLTVIIWAIYG